MTLLLYPNTERGLLGHFTNGTIRYTSTRPGRVSTPFSSRDIYTARGRGVQGGGSGRAYLTGGTSEEEDSGRDSVDNEDAEMAWGIQLGGICGSVTGS